MVPSHRLQQNKEEVWRDMDGMTKETMGLYQEVGSSVKGVGVGKGLPQAGCYRAEHETGEIKMENRLNIENLHLRPCLV